MNPFTTPGPAVQSDHPQVMELASRLVRGASDERDKARRLFLYARDAIAYTPIAPFARIEDYRASIVLARRKGFCVQKAVVLAALARAADIPARLVFVDIRNQQASPQLIEFLGTDLFAFHAYVELSLEGQWVAATPAFDRALCERQGYPVVEFDGVNDAVFPPVDLQGRPFITYEAKHGAFADVPLDQLLQRWRDVYGAERLDDWIARSNQASRP